MGLGVQGEKLSRDTSTELLYGAFEALTVLILITKALYYPEQGHTGEQINLR